MRPFWIVSVVLYLANAAQGLSAPLTADAPPAGADRAEIIEPMSTPLGAVSQGAGGRRAMINLSSLPEPTSPATLVTGDIPDSDDDYGSMSEYSRELFTALSIIGSEESGGTRSRNSNSPGYQSGGGTHTPKNGQASGPRRNSPPEFITRFVARKDSGGDIDLLAQYSAGENSINLSTGDMTSFGYNAGPASGRSQQAFPMAAGGSGSSRSFLHRFFCMLGVLSPEAVGLDQDCDYLP